MKKIIILGFALIGSILINAQVGINTTTPNAATVLDINSNTKGLLIPRLTNAERDASLADNDILTIPPIGVVNLALAPGTLIFNTTIDRFQFWDGIQWRELFVTTSSASGNDGVVRVDSGAGGALPMLTLTPNGNSYGALVQVLYTSPLVFAPAPVTSWPENTVPFPGQEPNIYVQGPTPPSGSPLADPDQRWVENAVYGQVHIWRVMAKVVSGNNASGSLLASFKNPDSNFEVNSISLLPSGSGGLPKVVTFYFYTIADANSIPVTRGYQLWMSSDLSCTVEIQSVTRVSLFKD